MVWMRTEEEVEALLNKMKSRSKGNYIAQAVTFNKNSESQMRLLKLALMSSYSFGGMMKELLNEKFSNNTKEFKSDLKESEIILNSNDDSQNNFKEFKKFENNENKSVGNFL